jgi:Alkylmercury lyase
MEHSVLDKQVRHYIYDYFVKTGQAPALRHCAQTFSCSPEDIQAAYQRLADGRALVLQSNGEILMAEPFSAVPTTFAVEVGNHAWWGNCIWDALGILAMLHEYGRVVTACGCCNDAMQVEIRNGQLADASGCVHFAIPPKEWWKNVVFA